MGLYFYSPIKEMERPVFRITLLDFRAVAPPGFDPKYPGSKPCYSIAAALFGVRSAFCFHSCLIRIGFRSGVGITLS